MLREINICAGWGQAGIVREIASKIASVKNRIKNRYRGNTYLTSLPLVSVTLSALVLTPACSTCYSSSCISFWSADPHDHFLHRLLWTRRRIFRWCRSHTAVLLEYGTQARWGIWCPTNQSYRAISPACAPWFCPGPGCSAQLDQSSKSLHPNFHVRELHECYGNQTRTQDISERQFWMLHSASHLTYCVRSSYQLYYSALLPGGFALHPVVFRS